MQGWKISDGKLVYQVGLDDFVPEDHVVRRPDEVLDLGYLYDVTKPRFKDLDFPRVRRQF